MLSSMCCVRRDVLCWFCCGPFVDEVGCVRRDVLFVCVVLLAVCERGTYLGVCRQNLS
jgi:hypothetical protein